VSGVPEGIIEPGVSDWFVENVADCQLPLTFRLIAGGHSNLTFQVTDATGRSWVLRRPPLGHVLPTAHDVAREHRIISALATTDVPVPAAVGLCTDLAVNGAPFYVMELVEGLVLRDTDIAASAIDEPTRYQVGLALADVLASIHAVVPAEVGLGDLGRPAGYVARQLKRWKQQLDDSRTRPLRELDDLHAVLSARIPEQTSTGLVHGDYRLDNAIIGPDASVRAVLDWELCTQGDTMADLGMLMVYWASPDDPVEPLRDPPTYAPGFPTRQEMLGRYAAARGIAVPDVDYYVAFGYWRLACITEGVYARYLHGDMGDRVEQATQFDHRVIELGTAAASIVATW
jgi:aminoglycoside phosphotransferase (APT) family kinase protein